MTLCVANDILQPTLRFIQAKVLLQKFYCELRNQEMDVSRFNLTYLPITYLLQTIEFLVEPINVSIDCCEWTCNSIHTDFVTCQKPITLFIDFINILYLRPLNRPIAQHLTRTNTILSFNFELFKRKKDTSKRRKLCHVTMDDLY